jgi:hypothetical protein
MMEVKTTDSIVPHCHRSNDLHRHLQCIPLDQAVRYSRAVVDVAVPPAADVHAVDMINYEVPGKSISLSH